MIQDFKARTGRPSSDMRAPHLEPMDYLILRSTLAMTQDNLDDFFQKV